MRRSYLPILAALVLLASLSGCGAPAGNPIAAGATTRPTAFMLPTAAATGEVPPLAPSVTAELLVPTEAPPPPPEPAPTLTVAPTIPAAPTPTEPQQPATTPPPPAPTEVPPTPTSEVASATPVPMPAADHVITVDEPLPGAQISSPFVLRGSTNFWPFEAALGGVLKDAAGNVLARFAVTVQSPDMGLGGPFVEEVSFPVPESEQQGTLEISETSPKDGSVVTFISILVRLVPPVAPDTTLQIEQPQEGAAVMAPLHVVFGGAGDDEHLRLRLTQADGGVLTRDVQTTQGYVVTALLGKVVPGPATLDVVRDDGSIIGRRMIRFVAPAEAQIVRVAWLKPGSEEIVLVERHVPRTPQIVSAALDEMLRGPLEGEAYASSLPTPDEVLASSLRTAGWGPRVRLLKLTITDGTALANFGPELRAYGGGSARVSLIRKQIEATLRQFPSVGEVVIAVDGQTEGVLEP